MTGRLLLFVAVVGLVSCGSVQGGPAIIAVYESEANAAKYHGAYQEPLRTWLQGHAYQFEIIGDKAAGDPSQLKRFAVVVASSCYIVPDAAGAGFKQYVTGGGHLLWIDGPALCHNPDLLTTLGLSRQFTYASMKSGLLKGLRPEHPACAGMPDSTISAVGNWALQPTGEVVAALSGSVVGWPPTVPAEDKTFPALIVNKMGQGHTALLNWIIWAGVEPEGRGLLAGALEWLLAQPLLRDRPSYARLLSASEEVAQPQPIACRLRVFGRPELAGKTAALRVRLLNGGGEAVGQTEQVTLALRADGDGDLAFAAGGLSFPTAGLPDGQYRVVADGKVDDLALEETRAEVTLNGQMLARLEKEQGERAKLLRPRLAGTLGDYDAEPRTPEHRVDLPRLFTQIEAAHMNMYDFLIWHEKTDWEDFQSFVAEAKRRGLKVWLTLAPPSEPPPSAPFGLDYLKWAEEIGKLSQKYDNLVAVVVDDFWSGGNHSLFTRSYIARFATTLRSLNPKVAFLPTIYWGDIGNADFMKDYGTSMDGIVFPYADIESTKDLPRQLEACRKWLGPNRFLLINVYAAGSSGTGEKGPRTPEYIDRKSVV